MSTKKQFSDNVLYKLAGGVPPSGFPVDERDIWGSLDHKVNALFKLHHFDATLANGETIPENTMIATYENITVTSSENGKSYALLPVNPISLPKNTGIFLIYDPNHPDNPFVPLQRGQLFLLKADELLNDLMGQIGYEPINKRVIFTRDLTSFGVTSVTMELCVFAIADYSITQELPIPADYLSGLEDEIVQEFAPVVAGTGLVNNFTDEVQKPK